MSSGSLFLQYDSRVFSTWLRFALVRYRAVAFCVAFGVLLLYLLVAAAADSTTFASSSHSA